MLRVYKTVPKGQSGRVNLQKMPNICGVWLSGYQVGTGTVTLQGQAGKSPQYPHHCEFRDSESDISPSPEQPLRCLGIF